MILYDFFFLSQFSSKSFNSNMTFQNFWKTPHDNAMHPMFCCVICKSAVTVIISVWDILQTSGSMEAVRPTQTVAKASGSRLEPRFQLLKAATRAAGEFATVSKVNQFQLKLPQLKVKMDADVCVIYYEGAFDRAPSGVKRRRYI